MQGRLEPVSLSFGRGGCIELGQLYVLIAELFGVSLRRLELDSAELGKVVSKLGLGRWRSVLRVEGCVWPKVIRCDPRRHVGFEESVGFGHSLYFGRGSFCGICC